MFHYPDFGSLVFSVQNSHLVSCIPHLPLSPTKNSFDCLRFDKLYLFFTSVLFFLPIFQTAWLHDLASPPLFLKTERESGRKSAMSYWPNSHVLTPYVLIATFKLRVYRKNQYLSIFHKKAIWNIKNWLRMDKIIQFHAFTHSTEWSCKLSVFWNWTFRFMPKGMRYLG